MTSLSKGYTMVELLIIISISGLLINLGTSSYRKAQERQALKTDVETTLDLLQSAKKQAVIGEKDCSGILLGVQVVVTQNSPNLSTQAICQGHAGSQKTISLGTSTPNSSTTFRFRPLDGSTTLQPEGSSFILNTASGLSTTFTISQSGAVTHAIP